MKSIRLAMIGCGHFANRVHYPSLATFDDVEIVAICDLDKQRLNATGDGCGIASRFTDYPTMLDDIGPDGVYIIMPEGVRFPIVKDCLERGLNVFMEKPPSQTTEQVRTLAEIAERNRCITMVGCNRRYIPVLVKARRMMHERGPVMQIVGTYYKNAVASSVFRREDTDVLVADGIHAVDTLRWLADSEAARVRGVSRKLFADCENAWHVVVEFENGCTGVLLLNWAAGNRYHAFELHGKGASAFVVPGGLARIVADGQTQPIWEEVSEGNLGDDEIYLKYGFLQENRHFIDCLKDGRETDSPFADAVKSMELIDMIKEACG